MSQSCPARQRACPPPAPRTAAAALRRPLRALYLCVLAHIQTSLISDCVDTYSNPRLDDGTVPAGAAAQAVGRSGALSSSSAASSPSCWLLGASTVGGSSSDTKAARAPAADEPADATMDDDGPAFAVPGQAICLGYLEPEPARDQAIGYGAAGPVAKAWAKAARAREAKRAECRARGARPLSPRRLAAIERVLEASAPALFDAGEDLGAGGFGVVRRVEIDGAAFALKRTDGLPFDTLHQRALERAVASGFVQVPIADCNHERSGWYSLLPLARGDLLALWQARFPQGLLRGLEAPPAAAAVAAQRPDDAWSTFAAVAAEMCAGLAHMHRARLRHGDVKPSNFLVAADGHLRVADLDTVRPPAAPLDDVACTQLYAPPEQWRAVLRQAPPANRVMNGVDAAAGIVDLFCAPRVAGPIAAALPLPTEAAWFKQPAAAVLANLACDEARARLLPRALAGAGLCGSTAQQRPQRRPLWQRVAGCAWRYGVAPALGARLLPPSMPGAARKVAGAALGEGAAVAFALCDHYRGPRRQRGGRVQTAVAASAAGDAGTGAADDWRAVDVWGLGMSWVHLLVSDDDALALAAELIDGPPSESASKPPATKVDLLAARLPPELADLLFGAMLQRDPARRPTLEAVMAHAFFGGVDWAAVNTRRSAAPF